MADWFLSTDDFAYFTDAVATWLAYGIGFGAVLWLIGQMVGVVYRFLRF